MKLTLGELACSGLEAVHGGDLSAGVRVALVHFVGKLRSGRGPIDVPSWLEQGIQGEKAVVDLEIDRSAQEILDQEADRQGITVSELGAHAVLVYLAELDFLGEPRASGELHSTPGPVGPVDMSRPSHPPR